jgi:hypothetical protein
MVKVVVVVVVVVVEVATILTRILYNPTWKLDYSSKIID